MPRDHRPIALIPALMAMMVLMMCPVAPPATADDEPGGAKDAEPWVPPPIELDIEVSRTRIEHAVFFKGTVRNVGEEALDDVRLRIDLLEDDGGEWKKFRRIRRGWSRRRMAAGSKGKVDIEEKQVPAFLAYRVTVSARLPNGEATRWKFLTESIEKSPTPEGAPPESGSGDSDGGAHPPGPLLIGAGEWSDGDELEVANIRLEMMPGDLLRVTGQLRNGTDSILKRPLVKLGLRTDGDPIELEIQLEDELGPGWITDFETSVESPPRVSGWKAGISGEFIDVSPDGPEPGRRPYLPDPDAPDVMPLEPLLQIRGGIWLSGPIASPIPLEGPPGVPANGIFYLRFKLRTPNGASPRMPCTVDIKGAGGVKNMRRGVSPTVWTIPRKKQRPTPVVEHKCYYDYVRDELLVPVTTAAGGEPNPAFTQVSFATGDGKRWTWKELEVPWTTDSIQPTSGRKKR